MAGQFVGQGFAKGGGEHFSIDDVCGVVNVGVGNVCHDDLGGFVYQGGLEFVVFRVLGGFVHFDDVAVFVVELAHDEAFLRLSIGVFPFGNDCIYESQFLEPLGEAPAEGGEKVLSVELVVNFALAGCFAVFFDGVDAALPDG